MTIDLNADLGEGFGAWRLGDDDALLDVVTSANVACGFHAGDPLIMARTSAAAVRRGVAIGAQVGYRDLAGFGRRRIEMAEDDLVADLVYQVGALREFAHAAGGRVGYLKPHGALYNTAADDPGQARAVARAAATCALPLLGLPASAMAEAAGRAGIEFVAEAFADRGYLPSGRLVPRAEPGAVLHDVEAVCTQALHLATTGSVTATDGTAITVGPASLCIHGDTPGAVELARAVRTALTGAGVELAPFTGG